MKTFTTFASFLLLISGLQAQDYQISFTGSGQSTFVDSIQIENLTQGTTLRLYGDDVLHLGGTVGINSISGNINALKIYPNPMITSTIVEFFNSSTKVGFIEIFNEMGVLVVKQRTQVHQGWQRFEISGLNAGIYTVNVSSAGEKYAAKIVSLGKSKKKISIKHQSTREGPVPENGLKSTKDLVLMQYNDGDMILFKGFAGNYVRVLTLLPTQSQNVNFEFVLCSDEDGNNYSVVNIGTQTWMAENLNTTKYNDGTDIPNVTDPTAWANLSTPAFCWYNNNQVTYGNTNGALYNWYTVETGELCPTGWHVPTYVEWNILIDYLGGVDIAGGKLKETGTIHWNSPNTGATNETGFTGLPGGDLYNGIFELIGEYGIWWSSTEFSSSHARDTYVNNHSIVIVGSDISRKYYAPSVRCLKD